MLKLKKIAITGGVASGKTSVCQLFKELGAYTVSADAITHKLLDPKTDLGQQVIQQFGPEILKNGQIDRKVVAKRAFEDEEQLKNLEKILHPAVLETIKEHYKAACKANTYTSFVVEIPLLYEIGAQDSYDLVIAVLADETEAKKRFKQAGFQETEYDLRMKRQLSIKQKAAKANYTIINNGSLEDLKSRVQDLNRNIHQL